MRKSFSLEPVKEIDLNDAIGLAESSLALYADTDLVAGSWQNRDEGRRPLIDIDFPELPAN
ncbi:MAG: hypothetical protein IT169_00635 [Bryobacterales bacterium]|nr:hypothetical protein [Bryobacterales bacterium]